MNCTPSSSHVLIFFSLFHVSPMYGIWDKVTHRLAVPAWMVISGSISMSEEFFEVLVEASRNHAKAGNGVQVGSMWEEVRPCEDYPATCLVDSTIKIRRFNGPAWSIITLGTFPLSVQYSVLHIWFQSVSHHRGRFSSQEVVNIFYKHLSILKDRTVRRIREDGQRCILDPLTHDPTIRSRH